jgi:hypothetical protein
MPTQTIAICRATINTPAGIIPIAGARIAWPIQRTRTVKITIIASA